MHIIRLEAQNIQRLQAVTIEPSADSPAVVLAGGNEEGKSSILDSIEMALAGEKVMPPEPIRRGQEKAHVVVDLGDMIVTRRYTSKGSSLTVTNREGLKYPSPQALLDGLYNKLTFDPLAFAHAKPADQAATLRKLASLDTTALDQERLMVFNARTEVNRDLAKARAVLEKAPQFEGVSDELQDSHAIKAKLDDADRLARVVAEAERQVTLATGAHASATDRERQAREAVQSARDALARAEQAAEQAEQTVKSAAALLAARLDEKVGAEKAVPDVAALRAELAGVDEYNRKVEANRRRAALATELEGYQKTAEVHTKRIEAIDKSKTDTLAAAKFPVEGLGLSDAGVTWNELPFEQASTAIRTRVSVAIGFALHPKLKVLLVRNGNDLDGKNLKLLADAAAKEGGQVWIERIAGGDGLQTVVIEDGAVKGATAEPKSQIPNPKAPVPPAGLPLEEGVQR